MLRYVKQLKDRMEKRSFPKDDKLYRLVARIHDDMHHLSVSQKMSQNQSPKKDSL